MSLWRQDLNGLLLDLSPPPQMKIMSEVLNLSKNWRLRHLQYEKSILLSTSVMSDSVQPHRRQPTRVRHPWDSPGKNTGVGCHFLLQCMKVKRESQVAQLCPTLSNPMNCSLPGSSVHGLFQARVLEWGAIAFSIYITSMP